MIQEIVNIDTKNEYFGVLTYDIGIEDTLILFLNAGGIYRIGSNRLHVKLAQALANEGFSSFRFDFSGIGENDSTNDHYSFDVYQEHETIMVMDYFQKNYKIEKFILFGICSGAKVAFNVAQYDERISGLIIANGFYLEKNDRIIYKKAKGYIDMLYYKRNLFDFKRWIKVLTGNSNFFTNVFSKIKIKPKNNDKSIDYSIEKWKELSKRKIKTSLIFSEGSLSWGVFNIALRSKLNNESLINLKLLKKTDHVFTSYSSQIELIDYIKNQLVNYHIPVKYSTTTRNFGYNCQER